MKKASKFTVSVSAAEFQELESLRRKAGQSRSQFIRDAVRAWKTAFKHPSLIREDHPAYPPSATAEAESLIGIEERRRRAIAAVGQFRSGLADLSADHDRYLEEAYGDAQETKNKAPRS